MAYLAQAGFDVFSMDMTGYGRSTRPAAMNDPCNLSAAQQKLFVPALIPKTCDASYSHQMTTLPSDWHDIDAVVDHVRALRHVEKLNLLAWSLGGPRSGGYAAQHADKVAKLVLLAPAYKSARRRPMPWRRFRRTAPLSTRSLAMSSLPTGIARWAAAINTTHPPEIPSGRKCSCLIPWAQLGEAAYGGRRR